jgi:hypothetical protein
MSDLKPKHIAWLIPLAYLFHLLDEYFMGEGFPNWFSDVFRVDLSDINFTIINSVGLIASIVIVILYTIDKVNNFVIAALGTLFFVNGIIHFLASLFTLSYSPGTISGILLYLPLGYLIFKRIFPLIPQEQRALSFAAGIIIQVVVALVAMNI